MQTRDRTGQRVEEGPGAPDWRNRHRFRSTWRVPVSPERAYAALRDAESYPKWWPEVRRVRRLDPLRVAVLIRPAVPYELRVVLKDRRCDEASVIESEITGDVAGWLRWTVRPEGEGSVIGFEEAVVVQRRSMRVLAPVARPVFRLNHRLMMARGERGLRDHLRAGDRGDGAASPSGR
jgi:hypothetical protein